MDGTLWFGTGDQSISGRNLPRDPRVSIHLESGDDPVILEGAVETFGLAETPPAMMEHYSTKYNMSADEVGEGIWCRLAPQVALTWLEHDFIKTAARWTFE